MATLNPTHAIAHGDIFEYADKFPYVKSGFGDNGIVRWNEVENKLQCHECGLWFRGLAFHIKQAHLVTAKEYRHRHGLARKTSLVVPSLMAFQREHARRLILCGALTPAAPGDRTLTERMAKRDKATPIGPQGSELINVKGHCHAQIMASFYTEVARLGRTPRANEFASNTGIKPALISRRFGKTYNEFVRFCGEIPAREAQETRYSKTALIELLRDFYVANGKLPNSTDLRRGRTPRRETYIYRFGSWEAALEAAGLLAEYRRRREKAS